MEECYSAASSAPTKLTMPELPEVETVCNGLRPYMEGRCISSLEMNRADLRFPLPTNFSELIDQAKVESISRRGKYILIHLDNDHTLIAHLGMSGRFLINPTDKNAHDHIAFHLGKDHITYRDPRRFGFMDIEKTEDIHANRFLEKLGIEPLSYNLTPKYLKNQLNKKRGPIKNLLLNQSIIAGLGNIYVCEALFDSGIHPAKRGCELTLPTLEKLCPNIKDVLTKAILAGGSSLKDYQQANGELGYFQHQFKVYGRENEPCLKCGTKIHRIVQSGRSTFYCSNCQT